MSIEVMKPSLEAVLEMRDYIRTLEMLVRELGDRLAELESPAPQRQWVGLTWHDMPNKWVGNIPFTEGAKWAEATLKEKNT